MVNDVIGGHVTSKFLNILCKFFLLSSKNMRQHFFVKYVKTNLSFGPNGRKIDKIYHREKTIRALGTRLPVSNIWPYVSILQNEFLGSANKLNSDLNF